MLGLLDIGEIRRHRDSRSTPDWVGVESINPIMESIYAIGIMLGGKVVNGGEPLNGNRAFSQDIRNNF
jgi:hypothetical protein